MDLVRVKYNIIDGKKCICMKIGMFLRNLFLILKLL